ncbi:MAG: hypothetical protein JW856_05625 [Dehalococcoidales bacterium]|nr:hypothetical protein [Dehalococcoidales bacterium]
MTNREDKETHKIEIPPQLDIPLLVKRMRLHGSKENFDEMVKVLAEEAVAVARPRAIYKSATVSCIARDKVDIDGVHFTSRILGKMFYDGETIYPFIATVGPELDKLKYPSREMMKNFTLDAIKMVILINAVDYLSEYLKTWLLMRGVAFLNPGELEDWPITEQKQLFKLFGGKEREIGVSLTSGTAMHPIKSRSGIIFPDETGFLSCRLCTQIRCAGRKAAYDPKVVEEIMR